jgi:Uma2 family endonuclease
MSTKTLITCDEFELLSQKIDHPTELIDGEIIHLSPAGMPQGFVTARILRLLGNFVDDHDLGWVLGNEIGLHVNRKKQRTRGADASFISYTRLPKGPIRKGFLNVPPELIVEVFGENDKWPDIEEKVRDYHDFGVDLVWVADPETQTIKVFPRGGPVKLLKTDDEIDAGFILPGFKSLVAKFFNR